MLYSTSMTVVGNTIYKWRTAPYYEISELNPAREPELDLSFKIRDDDHFSSTMAPQSGFVSSQGLSGVTSHFDSSDGSINLRPGISNDGSIQDRRKCIRFLSRNRPA
jgi:hypothetical protein